MAHEFARNIQDTQFAMPVALPNGDNTVQSGDFDLGADIYKGSNYEIAVSLPDLTELELGDAKTLTVAMATGNNPGPLVVFSTKTFTGSIDGLAAQEKRFPIPSDCPRYVSFLFTGANGAGDMSAKSATLKLVF
jgi:hypothetical protein